MQIIFWTGFFLVVAQPGNTRGQDGVVRMALHQHQDTPSGNPVKRQFELNDLNEDVDIHLEIGNPSQRVPVQIDTGSDDFWVAPKDFDISKSKSVARSDREPKGIIYGTGHAEIEFYEDSITIGSAKLPNQTFGVATDTDTSPGIMGLSPSVVYDKTSVLSSLRSQGLTKSNVFTLNLQKSGDDAGSIVFGGVDAAKFSGRLQKIPIIPFYDAPDGELRYWVHLDGISVTSSDGEQTPVLDKTDDQAVVLDSGSSLSLLPTSIMKKLSSYIPTAKREEALSTYFVDCSTKDLEGSVSFTFGDFTVDIPWNKFIVETFTGCKLSVQDMADFNIRIPLLGAPFLQSVAAVFNLDDRMIHLGKAKDCGTNLVAVTSDADVLSDLVGDC